MTTPKQKAANLRNALKSTGPKSEAGKRRSRLNAVKHGLSLAVDQHLFGEQIREIAALLRSDCVSDSQAVEVAKRIIDFERNEAYLQDFDDHEAQRVIFDWQNDPYHTVIAGIAQAHRDKKSVPVTFTTPHKDGGVRLKGRERIQEMQFIDGFLSLMNRGVHSKSREVRDSGESALRYQRRAINQLVKGIRAVARGQEF